MCEAASSTSSSALRLCSHALCILGTPRPALQTVCSPPTAAEVNGIPRQENWIKQGGQGNGGQRKLKEALYMLLWGHALGCRRPYRTVKQAVLRYSWVAALKKLAA